MKKPLNEFGALDISSALRGWSFQPGQVNVRLIRGADGKPKLQLRLDLGLLQMELSGRPDGKRPHRSVSELEFQTRKLRKQWERRGDDGGFALTPRDCQALREESAMFYHRYLSLFVLEQYESVVRDTQHNLDVLDLCSKYGRSDHDRTCLEQYRPYVIMMQVRAKGCEALRKGYVQTALAYLRGGVKLIVKIAPDGERRKQLRRSNEAQILLDMIRQIRRQLPPDPRRIVQKQLKAALAAERYEEAAELRDELLAMEAAPPPAGGHRTLLGKAGLAKGHPELAPAKKAAKRSGKRREKPEEK